jgi:hypothetical protein
VVALKAEACSDCGTFLEFTVPKTKDIEEIFCANCGSFKGIKIKKCVMQK